MANVRQEDKTPCPFLEFQPWWEWGDGFEGRKHTEHTKAKMRASHANRVMPDDFGERVSKGMTGRKRAPFSDDWKKNMADAQKGRKHPPRSDEFREKVRQQMTGTKQSEETKRKRSEALKRYHAKRKQAL